MAVEDQRSSNTSESERDESPSERADRNFLEMVQELRVAQTGVQILFGFFLTLAFYDTFPTEPPNPQVLTVALLATMLSALCFTAPVLGHRMHFRQGAKERLVWLTHWMTFVGMFAMAVAMELGVWLVLALLWSDRTATITCAVITLVIVGIWVLWPWAVLRKQPDTPDPVDAIPPRPAST